MATPGNPDTKQNLIHTACSLFNKQGYNATGISEILRTCDVSIGSLYYHFPGGKQELGVEAIGYAADQVVARISSVLSSYNRTIDGVCAHLLENADQWDSLGSVDGLLVALVALETHQTNEQIRIACRSTFDRIQKLHFDRLVSEGHSEDEAEQLSIFILSVSEGAIILSVNSGTGAPLRTAAKQLRRMYEAQTHTAS